MEWDIEKKRFYAELSADRDFETDVVLPNMFTGLEAGKECTVKSGGKVIHITLNAGEILRLHNSR